MLIKLVDLLREPVFVPETMLVSTLLKDFQKGKVHMAIVIDEFGDTAGLVTLEDVIEEIVGEIQDEYDYEPADVQRAADGTLVFDGKTSMARLAEIYPKFVPPEGSFETIAGLVFQVAGKVPKEGDSFEHGELSFKIAKREGRRLRKIAVSRVSAKRVETPHATDSARIAAADKVELSHQGGGQESDFGSSEEIPPVGESQRMDAVSK